MVSEEATYHVQEKPGLRGGHLFPTHLSKSPTVRATSMGGAGRDMPNKERRQNKDGERTENRQNKDTKETRQREQRTECGANEK